MGNDKRILVKGYLRPDGTSYYVSIPKEVREMLNLKGGEYFVMKAKPEKSKISLTLVDFSDEE
ncbi:AbrB/MazE/SpoVT family DNA-binding domain-containing protein [Syntrophorhabdus aromaticivorans]|uniref:AbrB/MazE/SpoVT family DNA-binding domain-containing protein n=1 Tax=Syntrophorhabdus aromaticivorans TaxID=328301 RepID=A0A351U5J3_9BACT|nr:AbrB/MazE/SpoVT family DNA-binding domain-containing protein [Syntrophorhabdus aromaticivorans]NLW35954.1 AbrB/MazE/SpoVT family DNA-binding domain-containing protein [Syntrophorhabdus aromaticivorans]HBA55224.1 AbrB/MazE/SpoVT family DNA-binding domain-containing protein [Syntrophorhabdus aromaticivorans]